MTNPVPSSAARNESKEISDLRITINIIRDFLTLVELLDTLPNMSKVPYDVTRSLYQSVSIGKPGVHFFGCAVPIDRECHVLAFFVEEHGALRRSTGCS